MMVNTRSRQVSADPADPQDQGTSDLPPLPEEEEPPLDPLRPSEDIRQTPSPVQSFRRSPTPVRLPTRENTVEVSGNLADALVLLTDELRRRDGSSSSKRAKAKEPDTFDGSEPKKLNNFILLCNLYFRTNSAYSQDATKITFALSYLRGMALEFFEPSFLDSDELPDWMDNWDAFVRTLRTQFGPIDPTGDAESKLDHLKMQDNQHIVKYNVDFNALAIRSGWDEGVLRYRYYTGLAERIKDIMGQQGKPATLEAMKTLAHQIDSRYWERQREKSRAGKGKSDDKPDDGKKSDKGKKTDDSGKNPSSSNNGTNNSNKGNKNSKDNKSGKSSSSTASTNPLADKLGKDGKLTPQERQRRFDNNLCLFCGGAGHTAANCSKASSSAAKAKARSAQAKEKEPPAAGDSKKV
jgi:hypothetical protein